MMFLRRKEPYLKKRKLPTILYFINQFSRSICQKLSFRFIQLLCRIKNREIIPHSQSSLALQNLLT